MVRSSLKVGNQYLTISGLPVEVLEIGGDLVQLQSLASDNRLSVPKGYPLRPLSRGEPAFEMRDSPYKPRLAGFRRVLADPQPLAPIIDALLLEGGRTMKGLVREVKRRASAVCCGKDVAANVRARICWFRKKGYRVARDSRGVLRAVKETA